MQVADKVKELDSSKLLPYLEQQLKYGHIKEVLGLFPEITAAHPALKPELEAIHQRALARERSLGETQKTGLDVSQLDCPGCGAVLHHARADARAIACSYCGTRFDPADPQESATKTLRPEQFPPESFIRLGMVARFSDQAWQVVGRMCWQGQCREWDSEDGAWESTAWSYEEWMLLGEDRSFLYISQDSEGLELSQEFTPTQPGLPDRNDRKMTLQADVRPQNIDEHGSYQLRYYEGEFGWVPQIGEGLRSAAYSWKGYDFSAEARLDPKTNQPVEIEFFRTRSLGIRELLQAFDRQRELAELKRREAVAGQYRWWRRLAFLAGFGLLVAGLLLSSPGDVVARQSFSFQEVGADGALVGPFELNAVGRAHAIEMSASFADNSWAFAGGELLDDKLDAINAVDGDFWRESGYDEGHWSESNTISREYFNLVQAGTYYLRVNVDPGTAGTGTVHAVVRSKVVLSRYYYLAGIAALILGLALIRIVPTRDLLKGVRES